MATVNTKRRKKIVLIAVILISVVSALGIGVYMLLPYLPAIQFGLIKPDENKIEYELPKSISEKVGITSDAKKKIPSENRVVIPKIGVDSEIHESPNLDILLKKEGVWRHPEGKTPESEGNMTVAGHRFQYKPPNTATFYNLDKIEKGDIIIVFWKGKTYSYEVYSTFEVLPTGVDILDSHVTTHPHEITLYTCTPLGSDAKRMVVKADLIAND